MLYLGTTVLILLDRSYTSRFWTQFEAWLSMQQALPEGLRSSVGTQGERFHIKCIQNAVEQADQHAQTLKNDWANKTPDDAHAILSKPDISVTNQKDKDGQLPKIKALNTTVQAAFVRIKQQRDKVEREARDAETALDDAAADLEACMQQVKTEQLEHERLAAALQQAKEELEACKTHGCATDLPRLKEEMAEAVKEEDYDRKDVLKEKISAISGIEPAAAKVEKAEAELSEQRQKLDQAEDRKADLQIAHRASSRRLTEAQDEAAKVRKEAEQQQKTFGLATKPVPARKPAPDARSDDQSNGQPAPGKAGGDKVPPSGLYKGQQFGLAPGWHECRIMLHSDGTLTGTMKTASHSGPLANGTWDPAKLTYAYRHPDHWGVAQINGSFVRGPAGADGEPTWKMEAGFVHPWGTGTASVTYDPTGTSDHEADDCCFNADATIELRSGKMIRMDELAVGDVVRSDAAGGFSTVYTFAHRKGDTARAVGYRRILLESGHALELTAEHMVFVGKQARMAANVRLGDELNVVNCAGTQRVTQITTVYKIGGTFAPFTRSGSIVVNGVVASTYSGDYYSATLDGAEIASAQAVAKIALAPLAPFHALLDAVPHVQRRDMHRGLRRGRRRHAPVRSLVGLHSASRCNGEMVRGVGKV